MKIALKKLIPLSIIIINCIYIIAGCIPDSSKLTLSNNQNIKNELELLKEKGILTVLSSNDRPFTYIDPKTGIVTGLDGDIITEVAKRLGINKVEMKIVPLMYAIDELNSNGNLDILANGIYITNERKKKVLFTNPWYKEPESILIHKSSNFNSMDSLKNAIVGAVNGTVFLELVQKWNEDNLIKESRMYGSQSDLLLGLVTKEIDAAVLDSATATYILSQYNSLDFTPLPSYKPVFSGLVGGALKKQDTVLTDAFNKIVDEMKKDGTLLTILKKYGLNENNFVSIQEEHISN